VNKGLVLVCLGFVVMGLATAWSRSRRAELSPPAGQQQRYLYCPECGLEMTCPPEFEDRVMSCPHCVKRRMEVNSFSRANGDAPRAHANGAVLAIAVGMPVALAAAVCAASRLRSKPEQTPEGDARRLTCPGCRHKMNSKVFGPGSTAVCPACAHQFVVPGTEGRKEPSGDSAGVREWGEWLGSELTKKGGGRPRRA
jgi:uncharacterized paraquat-inducible protein A